MIGVADMDRTRLAAGSPRKSKVVSAEDAVRLIRNGDTVATSGFGAAGLAEGIINALEKRFVDTAEPRDLTLLFSAGQGDSADRGLNCLARDGLVARAIGGHWGALPKLGKMALDGRIEAYNLPQGVIEHLLRDIAAHRPGHFSSVGLGTFVDPRLGGGKINARTTEDLSRLIAVDGNGLIFYKAIPVNVGIIRGTTADVEGNITCEREAMALDQLSIAMAAHNCGGIVIAEVERVAERGSLDPRMVKVPGGMIDAIVVVKPSERWQTFGDPYNPALCGEIRLPSDGIAPMEMSERKIIARRAAMELQPGEMVNLGYGMPEGVAAVAAEEGVFDLLTLTTESGVFGGIPCSAYSFGTAVNPQAIIDQPYQFDFYDGGGLDISILGLAQADRQGNLNVSRFGPVLAGCGGFINICQATKKLVFVGTFTAGGLDVAVEGDQLVIRKEGRVQKFVADVEQRTFSGPHARARGQSVLYVTERCVFRLVDDGLELIEIAPGIDVEKDIMAHMAFRPRIGSDLARMDHRIFRDAAMDLSADLNGHAITTKGVAR
jgi:propionate CoA-transferase